MATTNKNFRVKNGLEVNSNATVDASGNANIAGNLTANAGFVSADTFRLDTSFVSGSSQIAELAWNPDDGTIEFAMKDGDVVHRIGQQMVIRVVNNTGSPITEGSVVYVSGSSGQQPRIALANAATESGSTKTFGFVTQNGGIANGADGYVCTAGIMRGVDVGAYTAGTALWLANVAGTFTSTKPVAPDNGVFLGWVIKEGNAGSILVHVQNGYELEELHNVLIDGTPADNEILAWDSTSSLWKNQTAEEANLANTANTGTVTFSGNVTVTSGKQFNGNAAGLTSIPAGNLTGTAANIVYTTTTSLPNVTSVNSTTIPGSSTLLTTSSTLDSSKLNTNTVVTLNATNVAATNVNATTVLVSGDANVAGKLSVTASSGDEGGEIFLNKSVTNTSINGGVTIDVYQNKLRFFEQGGSARGYYIDITAGGAGVGTALTGGGGSGGGTVTSIATTSPITGGTITGSGTIGINASSTNTVNYVVQRDTNGSFAGNVITATTFVGNTNASTITTGTLSLARGGTGGTDATTARANLGATTVFTQTTEPTGGAIGDIWVDTDSSVPTPGIGYIPAGGPIVYTTATNTSDYSTTYTPASGTRAIRFTVVGGGGGGAGVNSTEASGGGGGAGAYAMTWTTAIAASYTITVGGAGAGGTGGAVRVGGNGNTSSVVVTSNSAVVASAPGGVGAAATSSDPGDGGASGVGTIASGGGDGSAGGIAAGNTLMSGTGGASFFGGGGKGGAAPGNATGGTAKAYGAGGGGARYSSGNRDGGPGKAGIIIIEEFM